MTTDRPAPTDADYRTYAIEQLEGALDALRDDTDTDDILSAVALALMALRMRHNATDPITLTPDDVHDAMDPIEPVCVCPPEQVARGGYRGDCPACNPR